MDHVSADGPDGLTNAAWRKPGHGRGTRDKEKGAKRHKKLERKPYQQLALVTACAVQPASRAAAQIFSLSTRRAAESAMAGTSRSEAPNPGGAGADEEQNESIEILYEGPAASSGWISPEESFWEWSARRGAAPSFEITTIGPQGGHTGYGAILRLAGATAEGAGSSIRQAKHNAELAMWEGLCKKGGRRRIRLLDQGGQPVELKRNTCGKTRPVRVLAPYTGTTLSNSDPRHTTRNASMLPPSKTKTRGTTRA